MAYQGCCKLTLGALNITVLILGAAILCLGFFVYTQLLPFGTDRIPVAMMGIGAALMILSTLGFCAAIMDLNICLVTYVVILLVLIFIQVALASLEYPRTRLELNRLFRSSVDQMEHTGSPVTQDIQDYLLLFQSKFECCGLNGTWDWVESPWWKNQRRPEEGVPVSCCRVNSRFGIPMVTPSPTVSTTPGTSLDTANQALGFLETEILPKPKTFPWEILDLASRQQRKPSYAAGCNYLVPGSSNRLLRPHLVYHTGCVEVLEAWLEKHINWLAAIFFVLLAVQALAATCALVLLLSDRTRDAAYVS